MLEDRSKIHYLRLIAEFPCDAVLFEAIPKAAWSVGSVYRSGAVSEEEDWRRCKVIYENNCPVELAPVFALVRERVAPLLLKNGEKAFRLSTLQLLRYNPGDLFGAHRDAVPGSADWRRHSIVCYLNADYDGGETYFPDLDVMITPRPGYAVLFPSFFLHEGREVLSGTKYVINGFLTDPSVNE